MVLDLIGQLKLFQEPKDALRARVVEVVYDYLAGHVGSKEERERLGGA